MKEATIKPPDGMTRDAYLFDMDGTLADLSHRLHHVNTKPKNWPAFFDGCKDDAPHGHMRPVVQALSTMAYIIYVSGRPERCRKDTEEWLVKHEYHLAVTPPRLYMRADGDYRADDIVKAELLARIIEDNFRPIMAFDDRDRVVKMWRDNGIPCAQVAPGDF